MTFNATPVDGSTPAIPMSSAVSPGDKTPRPIRGGPEFTDSQGNILVDVGTTIYDVTGSGSITAAQSTQDTPVANATVALSLGRGQTSWAVDLRGTFSAGTTINFDGTINGTNWFSVNGVPLGSTSDTEVSSVVGGAPLQYQGNASGLQQVRVRASVLAGGDSITVTLVGSVAPDGGFLTKALPAGTASIGSVQATIAAIAASLAQANQVPVSSSAPQGKLTLSGTLTANSDNSITFSGGATVARRIRIQNESAGTIYWETDATASAGSPSLVAPAANSVSVEWLAVQCTTLHIFIPTGGTTTLNGSGGVKVTAYA